ncbi:Shortage in chiasmata [Thalictrum thalictroides]|uniref:Shortage in chiasmata n=1 Tax=Thalictrum thalictroides TaxID=46969 RepID=A0A7J6VRR0_THATH|nr:Shortage in chiasmata [Thalictrum thalictroides]
MRTRFLNIDYFTSHISNLDFLRLPEPQIDSSSPSNLLDLEKYLPFDSILNVSLDIERLPIENALSRFFSDVLPQHIDIDEKSFLDGSCCDGEHEKFRSEAVETRFAENEYLGFDEVLDEDKHRRSRSEAFQIKFSEIEDRVVCEDNKPEILKSPGFGTSQLEIKRVSSNEEKNHGHFELIQFETPEVDFLEESSNALLKLDEQVYFEVSDIKIPPGIKDENLEDTIPYPCKASESVYSVEKMAMEHIMEQKCLYYVEDDSSIRENSCCSPCRFPLLEVNETGLECLRGPSAIEEFNLLLEKIEFQHRTPKDTLIHDGQELLGSSDIDILECLSDHSPIKQCLDPEPASCTNLMLDVDFLCIKETASVQANSSTHPDTLVFLPVTSPLQFQEIQILDLVSFLSFEIFVGSQLEKKPKACDQLFGDNINSIGNMYESIVSHELALEDDTFITLPIPVFSDDIEIWSVSAVLEEILAQIKPHPSSASDAIYLDWHLLPEDRCEMDICSSYCYMLRDFDTYSISSELESVNNDMVVIDFVFSNDTSDSLINLESKEVFLEPLTDVSPRRLFRSEGKPVHDLTEEVAPKLFRPMSQFSDLDFFLNPRKPTLRRNSELPVKETTDAEDKLPIYQEGISLSISTLHEDIKDQGIKTFSNIAPVEDNNMEPLHHVGTVETRSMPVSVSTMPSATELKQRQSRTHSSPDLIIIMNTQNCDKEMLISRRSSYQKILAMEKAGTQVVEREINLPVDLIFSAAMCLVWYDHINIWQKSAFTDEASSSIPMCIENIATNILMSLSFAFSTCILVFEGESSFLAAVMESSDGLYVAAASLGVELQLFCSYTPDLTDEIILNCIVYATKLSGHIYPKMFESETLAESFLTKFPSVNPLSAHAILSSGGVLVDFLEWSNERRIREIKKYHVPDECVALFSVLCKYGEQEESKSGTTECSSASSAPDSVKSSSKVQSQRKRLKCITGPQAMDSSIDDYFLLEKLNQSVEGNLNASTSSYDTPPYQSRTFCRNHEALDEIQGFDFSLNDKFLNQKGCFDTSVLDSLTRNGINRSKNVYNGEVIDLDNSNLFGEELCIAGNSSTEKLENEKNLAYGNSLSKRRLSFVEDEYPNFPSFEDINLGIRSCSKDQNRKSEGIAHTFLDSDKEDMLPLRSRGELLVEKTMYRSEGSASRQISGQDTGPYGRTPLSKVIHSSGLQQGSPWTMEFLNKVKEKSRMHQESLLSHNNAILYGYPNSMEKITKRKSPSTLDCYRYQAGSNSGNQAGSNTKKAIKRKWQKQFIPPPNATRIAKAPASLSQTCTPTDKKARQTLSFARIGNETQSKLVWGDGNNFILISGTFSVLMKFLLIVIDSASMASNAPSIEALLMGLVDTTN